MTRQSKNKATRRLAKMRHKARIKSQRSWHKKFLLHPASVFFLLCVGVLWLGYSMTTHADLLQLVRGKVPASPLTEPAVITSPANGAQLTGTPIDVTGSCPQESYITMERNGVFAGAALCQSDGTFHIQVALAPGVNSLQAHDFNVTDDEGPLSPAITVTYGSPLPTQPTASAKQTPPAPFVISSSYTFYGYKIGQDINWNLELEGGTAPYTLGVDWGDGSQSNYVSKSSGNLTVDHAYAKAGVYTVSIDGRDGQGNKAFLQLVSVVTDGKSPAISVFTTPGSIVQPPTVEKPVFHSWTAVAAYSYVAIVLMVISYWLGEQHEYLMLVRQTAGKTAVKRRK